jgi:hypothetical protein
LQVWPELTRSTFQVLHSGLVSGPICQHHTKLERLARDRHFTLLQKSVNYGRKKFCSTGPRLEQKRRNRKLFPIYSIWSFGGYGEAKKDLKPKQFSMFCWKYGVMTFWTTTFSITTLDISDTRHNDTQHKWHSEKVTLSISDTQNNNSLPKTECHVSFMIILNVSVLNVVMLSIVAS